MANSCCGRVRNGQETTSVPGWPRRVSDVRPLHLTSAIELPPWLGAHGQGHSKHLPVRCIDVPPHGAARGPSRALLLQDKPHAAIYQTISVVCPASKSTLNPGPDPHGDCTNFRPNQRHDRRAGRVALVAQIWSHTCSIGVATGIPNSRSTPPTTSLSTRIGHLFMWAGYQGRRRCALLARAPLVAASIGKSIGAPGCLDCRCHCETDASMPVNDQRHARHAGGRGRTLRKSTGTQAPATRSFSSSC